MSVSINDIARLAGTHRSTVSRVLNRPPNISISDQCTRRILRLTRKLNYQPRHSAKSLATGKSYCIGVILGMVERGLASPYLSMLFAEMICTLLKNDYTLSFLPIATDQVHDDEVLLAVQRGKCDGFFVESGLIGAKTLKELNRRKIPIVVERDNALLTRCRWVNVVNIDFQPAVDELARELASRGHRHVAYMAPVRRQWTSRRFACFRKALVPHGIPFGDSDLIKYWPQQSDILSERWEAYQAADRTIDRLSRYTAIVGSNDFVLLGVADAMKKHGIEPGRDIALAGFDNIEENPSFFTRKPFLTSVDLGFRERGRQVADVLLHQIQHPDAPQKTLTIPTRLIIRESLGTSVRPSAN